MQTEIIKDRVWTARAVRRRMADHRLAEQLRSRGWETVPPADEIEAKVRERAV